MDSLDISYSLDKEDLKYIYDTGIYIKESVVAKHNLQHLDDENLDTRWVHNEKRFFILYKGMWLPLPSHEEFSIYVS